MSGEETSSARRRLDRLVLEAAQLEAGERDELLRRLGEEDAAAAAEVRRLLEAAGELSDDFLAAPPTLYVAGVYAGDVEAEEAAPPEGDERWQIGELLGRGGMASVYRAFDRRLGRPVALKLLDADDAETPRRLLAEARAQARVRHPHVLDVYETGELGGRPYVAMRHVAGGSLAELPAEVSLEQRVRLLAQAAEGLHAAHREGLLHGDVKPSNVLVEETADGEPTAWIADFGIASELAGEGVAAGRFAGTPRYMAPELLRHPGAAGDRRSDVFSLGVTLLQALTGELPERGDGWRELRRRHPELPPDLVAVAARCLAAEPEARYPSARAVAEELRRFLDGEAVFAYADRRAYRVSRFVGRHRALVAVAGVSALLLAAALLVAALAGLRAVRANARAEQRQAQAEELVGFMLVDLRDKLEPVGRLDLLDEVGDRAMDYFAAVPESELSDEELARRSMALYQLGDVRMRQGDLAGAERPFAESLALARRLAERAPDDPERLFGLGQSEFWAGYARWEAGDLEAARPHFEAYHAVSERLVELAPEERDYRLELSYAESNLGSFSQAQGNLEQALERFLAALAIDRELVTGAESVEEADGRRFELAATHNTVGRVLERLGRLDEAAGHYDADLEIRREMSARQPENRRWREFLAVSHQYRGRLALARGHLDAARSDLEAATAGFEELAERDPENDSWRYKLAWSLIFAGRLELASGRPAAAGAAWSRAAGLAAELAAADPDRLDRQQLAAYAHHHLALAALGGSAPRAALAEARRAVDLLGELHARQPEDRRGRHLLANALLLLGDAEAAAADAAAARVAWQGAAATLSPLTRAGGERDHEVLVPWAAVLGRLGRDAEAAAVEATLSEIGVSAGGPIPSRRGVRG